MANPEHLEILKQGVKVWNEWRSEHEDVQPDISHTNLSNTNLPEAYLLNANLNKANLLNANLFKAILLNTNLKHVNLRSANLRGAFIAYANLSKTIITGTYLKNADFTNCNLSSTILGGIDLSETKGLESVKHHSASTIGVDTIYKSGGNIPEIFLRRCGMPDEFIVYMRSLVANPIQFYSCFISYSSRDQNCAERLYSDLQSKSVRCWYAPEDLKIGDRFRDRIDESIRLRDKLLLILSEHSIASKWVENEVESALEEERQRGSTILFPVRIDDTVMESSKAWAALIRRTRHIGDFTRWKDHDSYQKAFDRLLRDLKAKE
jgi:hypothetical protein